MIIYYQVLLLECDSMQSENVLLLQAACPRERFWHFSAHFVSRRIRRHSNRPVAELVGMATAAYILCWRLA